jgi:hypothetical protein
VFTRTRVELGLANATESDPRKKILASAKEQEEVASGPDVVLNVTVKICTKRRRDFMTYLRGRHDGGRVR